MVGKSEAITSVNASNICTTTLNTAEFHTMVKAGKSSCNISCNVKFKILGQKGLSKQCRP